MSIFMKDIGKILNKMDDDNDDETFTKIDHNNIMKIFLLETLKKLSTYLKICEKFYKNTLKYFLSITTKFLK